MLDPTSDYFTHPLAPALTITLAVLVILLAQRWAEQFRPSMLQEKLGAGDVPPFFFWLGVGCWSVLFVTLFVGLLITTVELFTSALPWEEDRNAWRFSLLKLASLTAVLGAVVALPFTVIRISMTRRQNETAEEALFNDKMNAAVADLHAQRQITKWYTNKQAPQRGKTEAQNGWEDDITRRNGAIDRLEGLLEENDKLFPRVSRLLSIYVRELSRNKETSKPPIEKLTGDEFREWVRGLNVQRSDLEKAAQTLGRLPRFYGTYVTDNEVTLAHANLEAFDLSHLNFEGVNFDSANLIGALLYEANLKGAKFRLTNMQGTNLVGADLQGASLLGPDLRAANLTDAKLNGAAIIAVPLDGAIMKNTDFQGASFMGVDFGATADFTDVDLRGASFNQMDLTKAPQIEPHLETIFGDASVKLPEGVARPERFRLEYQDWDKFHVAWREFQISIGRDPIFDPAKYPE